MSAPVSYNNTTTELPKIPTHIEPPGQAVVLKNFAHGGIRFVIGQQDTAKSLFDTLYPNGRDQAGNDVRGGASHLQAYLAARPGGYPKPGDVVEVPNFWDFAGRASPRALDHANSVIERQEAHRCSGHGALESNGTSRLAQAITPRASQGVSTRASALPRAAAYAGTGFTGHGHQVVNLGPAIYGRRW